MGHCGSFQYSLCFTSHFRHVACRAWGRHSERDTHTLSHIAVHCCALLCRVVRAERGRESSRTRHPHTVTHRAARVIWSPRPTHSEVVTPLTPRPSRLRASLPLTARSPFPPCTMCPCSHSSSWSLLVHRLSLSFSLTPGCEHSSSSCSRELWLHPECRLLAGIGLCLCS
jgi:hypothetical protein